MTLRIWHVNLVGRSAGGVDTIFMYATRGYVVGSGFSGASAGTPVEARVLQPGVLAEHCFGAGRTRGAMDIATGVIKLANFDGALDGLSAYNFDGKPFSVSEMTEAGTATGRVLQGVIEQCVFSENEVTFQVRDERHRFDVDLLTATYGGSTATGYWLALPDDVVGTPRPALYGVARNFEPVCVDPVKFIYQVDGQRGFLTGWTLDVYDARSALTQGADYADQAAMEATAPAAGQYRVWPAGGAFRLGAQPTGILTCDGMNPPAAAPSNTPTVTSLLRGLGAAPALGGVHLSANANAGLYVRDQTTVLDVINRIAQSLNAWVLWKVSPAASDVSLSGITSWVSQLSPPASPYYTPASTALVLDTTVIVPGSLQQVVPAEEQRGLPVRRVNVRYRPNYRVMSATDVAGIALADLVEVATPYRVATADNSAVLLQYQDALELTVDTLLDLEADAQAEADRLVTIFGTRRRIFRLQVMAAARTVYYQLDPGRQVTLQYPRFGLDAGVPMLVLGAEEDIDENTVTLTVWG